MRNVVVIGQKIHGPVPSHGTKATVDDRDSFAANTKDFAISKRVAPAFMNAEVSYIL